MTGFLALKAITRDSLVGKVSIDCAEELQNVMHRAKLFMRGLFPLFNKGRASKREGKEPPLFTQAHVNGLHRVL